MATLAESNLAPSQPQVRSAAEATAEWLAKVVFGFYVGLLLIRGTLGGAGLGNVPVILFALSFFALTARYVLNVRSAQQLLVLVLMIFAGSLTFNLVSGHYGLTDIIGDTSTLINGPITFLWVLTACMWLRNGVMLDRAIWFAWIFISLAIIISATSGIGLVTYEAYGLGHKFFFASNNELTFCYTMTAGMLVLRSSVFRAIAIILATVFVLSLIGTKAGYLGLWCTLVCLVVQFAKRIDSSLGQGLVFFGGAGALLVLISIDLEQLVRQVLSLLSFSAGYEKMMAKMQIFGLWDAVLSGRGRFVDLALNEMFSSSIIEILFGIGFSEFKAIFGMHFGRESFTEVDIVDVFVSYGLLGVIVYLALALYILVTWFRTTRMDQRCPEEFLLVLLMFLLVGNSGGHVVFSAWAMATVAICLASTSLRLRGKLAVSSNLEDQGAKTESRG